MKLKKDYLTKPDNYYSLNRPELHEFIRENQKAILDVGCGIGKMALELKENKNIAEAWGIEPVEKFGKIAQAKLDKVFIMPVEEAVQLLPDNNFDTIIFADVLEHLVDPEEVLVNIKSKLAPGGEIFASIPNVRHWYIFRQLLEGDWEYTEHGLLDRTHLRYFTKKSIYRMFKNCGYSPFFVNSNKVGDLEIPDDVLGMLVNSGLDVSTLREEINIFQYFVRAKVGEIALIIPSQFITRSFLGKLSTFPKYMLDEMKIIVTYDLPTPIIEYIKSLNDPSEPLTAKQITELNMKDFTKVILLGGTEFDIAEVVKDYWNFDSVSLSGSDYDITSFNCAEFPEIFSRFINLIR